MRQCTRLCWVQNSSLLGKLRVHYNIKQNLVTMME